MHREAQVNRQYWYYWLLELKQASRLCVRVKFGPADFNWMSYGEPTLVDAGQVLGTDASRWGFAYGWNEACTEFPRNRASQRGSYRAVVQSGICDHIVRNTLIHIKPHRAPGSTTYYRKYTPSARPVFWSFDNVPAGRYRVLLTVGDNMYASGAEVYVNNQPVFPPAVAQQKVLGLRGGWIDVELAATGNIRVSAVPNPDTVSTWSELSKDDCPRLNSICIVDRELLLRSPTKHPVPWANYRAGESLFFVRDGERQKHYAALAQTLAKQGEGAGGQSTALQDLADVAWARAYARPGVAEPLGASGTGAGATTSDYYEIVPFEIFRQDKAGPAVEMLFG